MLGNTNDQSRRSVGGEKKVLVALSGGVDSAVSAALLKKQGYRVSGAHMVCFNEGPNCTSDQDRADAAKVASHLNIPFQVFDFRSEYKNKVIEYFYSEYLAGRTPNPDIACNREIKFGIFLNKALQLGYDFIATGHYARIIKAKGKRQKTKTKLARPEPSDEFKLFVGLDPEKDQSYFLYNFNQKQLSQTLFPIGHLRKTQVRKIALKLNLPNADKKDSQGICFIGEVDIKELISKKAKSRLGNIINPQGQVIGKHKGIAYYTIGQREGIGISEKIPHYIVAKSKKTNTIVAAPFNDNAHFKKTLKAKKINWISEIPMENSVIEARIRYRQPLFKAKLTKILKNSFELVFKEPQKAVTAGQAVVLYQNNQVLGGGTII